jgi:hypothetical protein
MTWSRLACYPASFGVVASLLLCTTATASQFYVFPVKELEGVSSSIPPEKRPLIDRRVRDLLDSELQTSLLDTFAKQLAVAFPASTLHAKQIGNTVSSKAFRYVDDDSQLCRDHFFAPIQQSYAAVVGISRGSWYEVSRERGVVELLIPITLNLQLVKPDRAKVVYSISETLYSPFRFGSQAELQASVMKLVRDTVALGLNQQIDGLVKQLQKEFQPKETVVTIAGRSAGVLVADKGFEVGFVDDDMPVAVNRKTGAQVIFTVLAAESGYTVLKATEGSASVGDEFVFQFEVAANDSRKPRVMPVVSSSDILSSAVSDLFAKDIGFNAAFQIAAVDANFKDTQDSLERKANCVAWDKFEAVRKDLDSRKDAPDFFLKFDYTYSPVVFESGQGGVETRESFMATVGAQLVDHKGSVVHAELGQNLYRLDKRGGRGLDITNAKEVALKNATSALAKKFISNVRFQPAEFQITAAGKSSFSVEGLAIPEGADLVIDVLRPLDVKIGGKPTHWRISFDRTDTPLVVDGNRITFRYSPRETEVRRGDRLIVANMPKRGQTRVSECATHYVAPGSVHADYLLPVVRHSAFASQRFQVVLMAGDFYNSANALLQEGKFKLKVAQPRPTEVCLRPGYLVKPDPPNCSGSGSGSVCGFDMLSAATIILEKDGQRTSNFVQAEKISLTGVAAPEVSNFTGLKAVESVSSNLPKLIEKLNLGK